MGELPKLAATDASGKNAQEFIEFVGVFDQRHTTTMIAGGLSLDVILGARFAFPRTPGALVLVVGAVCSPRTSSTSPSAASQRWGAVPRGLPAPDLPGLSVFTEHTATIATAALALVLIGFSQTVGDARMFASRRHAWAR